MISKLFSCLIIGLRPLFGPSNCRYVVGCTEFALIQLKEKPLLAAVWAIIKRIFSCIPFA